MSTLSQHIASKIKDLRTAAGLTQTDLAKAIEVTPNTVSRWESAKYQPTVADLDQLARVFEEPIWAFLPSDLKPATEEQQLLLSATGDLPAEDIEELRMYADFVRARRALKKPKKRV